MPAPGPSLLPGQSPPFFTVTPTDQAGVIVNVAAFCLVIAGISILIRAYVRFEIINQRISWDDCFAVFALIFYIAQSAVVFKEVHDGLGKSARHLNDRSLVNIQRGLYADDILYIISVWISKVAFALLFTRTSPKRGFRMVNWVLIGLIALTGVISICLITIRCNLSHPWIWFTSNGVTCKDMDTRWSVIGALDIATEVGLSLMSVYLVWGLQLQVSKKAAVVFAFSLRLAIIAPIAAHLHYIFTATASNDPSLRSTSFVICKQVELTYAIIAANIPVLRPFIIATATNYGAAAEGPKSRSGTAYGNNNSGGYGGSKQLSLRALSRNGNKSHSNSQLRSRGEYGDENYTKDDQILLRSNPQHTNITSGGIDRRLNDGRRVQGDERSVGSDGSEQMIIRKDVQYSVNYDQGR